MRLPESSRLQFTQDLQISRILCGMWQVSGAHGPIDRRDAIRSMFDYVDSGFTTWDLADHYGPAEDFIGEFRRQLSHRSGADALAEIQAFTKWVPRPGPMTRQIVESNIDLSLERMGVDVLDLLQFHWWDYQDIRYLDALDRLAQLQENGKIRHLALTNFDTEHTKTVVEHGIKIVSNQVQYSLVDLRPQIQMEQYCQSNNISLLAYGTLCGGLISEKYLDRPEPGRADLNTASLGKYKRMIDAWGGWDLFQELLVTLRRIADKHAASISNVAVRYVLDRPAVAGVIIGARLGLTDHREENVKPFDLVMGSEDIDQLLQVTSQARDLYQIIGDCGDEYRR